MKATVLVSFTYEIPDDLDERERIYGTRDPGECVLIDAGNPLMDLMDYSEGEVVGTTFEDDDSIGGGFVRMMVECAPVFVMDSEGKVFTIKGFSLEEQNGEGTPVTQWIDVEEF